MFCECGEIQSMQHLCACNLCPTMCTKEDLVNSRDNPIKVAVSGQKQSNRLNSLICLTFIYVLCMSIFLNCSVSQDK